jgi:hypothetical protein
MVRIWGWRGFLIKAEEEGADDRGRRRGARWQNAGEERLKEWS